MKTPLKKISALILSVGFLLMPMAAKADAAESHASALAGKEATVAIRDITYDVSEGAECAVTAVENDRVEVAADFSLPDAWAVIHMTVENRSDNAVYYEKCDVDQVSDNLSVQTAEPSTDGTQKILPGGTCLLSMVVSAKASSAEMNMQNERFTARFLFSDRSVQPGNLPRENGAASSPSTGERSTLAAVCAAAALLSLLAVALTKKRGST